MSYVNVLKFLTGPRKVSRDFPHYKNGPKLANHEGPQEDRHALRRPHLKSLHRDSEVVQCRTQLRPIYKMVINQKYRFKFFKYRRHKIAEFYSFDRFCQANLQNNRVHKSHLKKIIVYIFREPSQLVSFLFHSQVW